MPPFCWEITLEQYMVARGAGMTGQPLCRPSLLEKKPRIGFVRSTFSAVIGSEVMRTPTASSMTFDDNLCLP